MGFILLLLFLPFYSYASPAPSFHHTFPQSIEESPELNARCAFLQSLRHCRKLWLEKRTFDDADLHLQTLVTPHENVTVEWQREQVIQFLEHAYEVGKDNDDPALLCRIYPWMVQAGIDLSVVEKNLIGHCHILDAQYHYSKKNYKQAEAHLRWALMLLPEEENAIKLLAVVLFGQKRYKEAERIFELFTNDPHCNPD